MTSPQKDMLENVQHSTEYIPYSFYECDIPRWFMRTPMHWHSEFELNYVVRGMGEFICGGERYIAGEGSLFLLPPNMLHAAYPYQASDLLYHALVFSPAMLGTSDRCAVEYIHPWISGSFQIAPMIPSSASNYPSLKASARQIFGCLINDVPCGELLLKSELLRFFWLLETDDSIIIHEKKGPDYGERIRPVLEYMAGHYHEELSISRLAGIARMSASYFMSCFKKAVGCSAIEYVSHLRISAAFRLLAYTEETVSEIALACGYGNLSNFNRQFRKASGCSPREYRKQFT